MKVGIEIEFITNDITLLLCELSKRNVEYIYVPRLVEHIKTTNKEVLVVKPDKSLGADGWEVNFPPTYPIEEIEYILKLVSDYCEPVLSDKAAMHIHVDTYYLSQYDIDRIYEYYYTNQDNIIADAAAEGLYAPNLNQMLPQNRKEVKSRKTNMNFRSLRLHKTLEHRIYKSTLDIDNVKWAVTQTLDIIEKAITNK